MTPASAISMLDRYIARNGQEITLRRWTGTGPDRVKLDGVMMAFVRRYDPVQMAAAGAQMQGTGLVILSTTSLSATGWPGAAPAGYVGDWNMPRKGDDVVTQDGPAQVMMSRPFRMDGVLVRVELLISG